MNTLDELADQIHGILLTKVYVNDIEKTARNQTQSIMSIVQAWHKDKARSYVPGKPSNELTHMSIAEQHGYEQAIDQTLKSIEESK